MTTQKHTHKLKRLSFKSGNRTFFCCLPDCTFKISVAMSLGKRNVCWRCGNDFIMNEYSIRLAKPHCENCHISKVKDKTDGFTVNSIIVDAEAIRPTEALSLSERSLSLQERLTATIQGAKREDEDI